MVYTEICRGGPTIESYTVKIRKNPKTMFAFKVQNLVGQIYTRYSLPDTFLILMQRIYMS